MFNNPWISSTIEPGTHSHSLVKSFSDFRDHEKIEDLEELISGKRICIVGPAPSLEGTSSGSHIDSYDLVVRVNQMFEMSGQQKDDYGHRSDLLIGGFNNRGINQCISNMDYIASYKLILGVMPNIGYKPIEKFFGDLDILGVKSHLLDDRYIYKVFREVGTVTNTGLIGIITLLNYDLKELYITGFTFHNMGNFGKIYNEDYFNHAVRSNNPDIFTQEQFTDPKNGFCQTGSSSKKIHDIQTQIKYFSSLQNRMTERIKLDPYLEKNFKQ